MTAQEAGEAIGKLLRDLTTDKARMRALDIAQYRMCSSCGRLLQDKDDSCHCWNDE